MSNPTLITVKELAEHLRVSRSFIYHQAAAGRIPAIHVGSKLRFDFEAVLKALKSGDYVRPSGKAA